MNTLKADRFPIVDQGMARLEAKVMNREDDRMENADVIIVERAVDEDSRRPPPHGQAATFIRLANALIS